MNVKTILMLLSVLLVGSLTLESANADNHTEQMRTVVYPITFGEPTALKEISESIVDKEGHVVLDQNKRRLIIVTTGSRHQQLKEILQPAEPLPANIRIVVNMIGSKQTRSQKAAVHGSGGVIFESGQKPRGGITLRPEIENSSTELSTTTGQQLLIANGRPGSLRVGERVPYIAWITDYGWRNGWIEQHIDWQEVGSFLTVTPTILADGSTIRVKLTPQLRGIVDGNPYHTSFVELATEVIAGNGQTIQIGGSAQNDEFYSKFLVGFNRGGFEESLRIELTPTISRPYVP